MQMTRILTNIQIQIFNEVVMATFPVSSTNPEAAFNLKKRLMRFMRCLVR